MCKVDKIEKESQLKLRKRNLQVIETETCVYSIKRNGQVVNTYDLSLMKAFIANSFLLTLSEESS